MKKKNRQPPRLWTLPQVRRVSPLVSRILAAIRDDYLLRRFATRRAEKITSAPGRLGRADLIALDELRRQESVAKMAVDEAVAELRDLGVVCMDPIRSVAWFRFSRCQCGNGCNPAWFTYSRFQGFHWRFDSDPMDMRRSVVSASWESRL